MKVQLGRPVTYAKLHLEFLETGHLLASFQTQGRPFRIVRLLPDLVLVQVRLAVGVVLQLQGPDGRQARRSEVGEEPIEDGLRADDECDLLVEEMMGFLMDLLAREEHRCQTGQRFDFWPLGESSVSTSWPARTSRSLHIFRVAQRGFRLFAFWTPRGETAVSAEWKDLEDVLSKGVIIYLDTQLSRELEEWESFAKLLLMKAIGLGTLGVGGLAVRTLAIGMLATSVSGVGRFGVGILAVHVGAAEIVANGNLAIGVLAVNDLANGSLAHGILAVGVFALQRTSLESFLSHRCVQVIVESSNDIRVKAKKTRGGSSVWKKDGWKSMAFR